MGDIMKTERLLIREFEPADLDALFAILSDPETMRHYPAPKSREECEQWIRTNCERYAVDGHGLWAVADLQSGEFLGDVGIVQQMVPSESGEPVPEYEIGYHIRRDHWGRGLATEAADACRRFGFGSLDCTRLISLVRPENTASARVAEKLGMAPERRVTMWGLEHVLYALARDD